MGIKTNIAAGVFITTAVMTGYIKLQGKASTEAATKVLVTFSNMAIQNWKMISDKTGVSIDNTEPGTLQPLIPAQFGAIDLVIYGTELVEPKYKNAFESFGINRLADLIQFSNKEDGSIQYHIGGGFVHGIKNLPGNTHGAVFYTGLSTQVVEGADQIIDGGDGMNTGSVRWQMSEPTEYVVGIYLPYEPTPIVNTSDSTL